MKQCPYCGTMLYDNAVVCNICGFNYQYYYYQQQMYQRQMYQQQLYQQQIAQRQAAKQNQPQSRPQTYNPQAFQQTGPQQMAQTYKQSGYAQYGQPETLESTNKNFFKLSGLLKNNENDSNKKKRNSVIAGSILIVISLLWFVIDGISGANIGTGGVGTSKASDEETAISIVTSSQVTVNGQLTTGRTVGQMLMTMFSDVDTRVRFNEDKSKAVVSFSGYYSVAPGVPAITFGVIEYTVDMKSQSCWVSSDDNNISVLYYSNF